MFRARSYYCRHCCCRLGSCRFTAWVISSILVAIVLLSQQGYLRRGEKELPWKAHVRNVIGPTAKTVHGTISRLISEEPSAKVSPSFYFTKEIIIDNGVPHHLVQPREGDRVWPNTNETKDRMLAQVNLVPEELGKLKKVVHFDGQTTGPGRFVSDKCPVDKCEFVSRRDAHVADVIVVNTYAQSFRWRRTPKQIVVWFMLESPLHNIPPSAKYINWTATYRRDSILTTPYQRFTHYKNFTTLPPPARNFAKGKTKLLAWFVSNCLAKNGRQNYVAELRTYIRIDIYGGCGTLNCPRGSIACEEMLSTDYKFYLSFENSNCVDYITEKLYWNALWNTVVPVVMGARPEDYAAVAPPNSYIHVDDFQTPRDLARYLLMLSENDAKYNEYFRWQGTGEFIDTKFWCRLCALAHETERSGHRTYYENLSEWWSEGVCLKNENSTTWSSWRNDSLKIS